MKYKVTQSGNTGTEYLQTVFCCTWVNVLSYFSPLRNRNSQSETMIWCVWNHEGLQSPARWGSILTDIYHLTDKLLGSFTKPHHEDVNTRSRRRVSFKVSWSWLKQQIWRCPHGRASCCLSSKDGGTTSARQTSDGVSSSCEKRSSLYPGKSRRTETSNKAIFYWSDWSRRE